MLSWCRKPWRTKPSGTIALLLVYRWKSPGFGWLCTLTGLLKLASSGWNVHITHACSSCQTASALELPGRCKKEHIVWLKCHRKKSGIVQMLVLLCFGLHCTCCQKYMFDTVNHVHLSPCALGASVHMLYSSGNRRGGCWNGFAAVQLLLPWTLRAAGGGRGEVKRHNGMPLALCGRDTAAVLPTLLSSGDVLVMCPHFNPNASHLLPSPVINKIFFL